jgi:hypothetical protein
VTNTKKNRFHIYTAVKKGDLVEYIVEKFTLCHVRGTIVEEEKVLGIVVSDLIECSQALYHNFEADDPQYQLPIGGGAYFKIFSFETQICIYIEYTKIEIIV